MWPFPSSQPVGLRLSLRGTEGRESLYDLEQIASDPIRDSSELSACAWQRENSTAMVFGNVFTVKSGLSSDPLRMKIEDTWTSGIACITHREKERVNSVYVSQAVEFKSPLYHLRPACY